MEGVKNELDFYSKFARPLIFALPEAKDRVLAASWVKKIKDDENTSEKLKTDYIKLLLFALQRRKLVGIFTDDPTNYEILEEFPDEYDLNAMAQDLIETEQKERCSNIRRQLQGQMGDFPPYTTDISSDLREYVAAQDIPCFGVHCYYAISKDPITTWQNAEKGIFPKAAKSAVNTNSALPSGSRAPDTCVSCPGPEGTEPCSPGSPSPDQPDPDKRKKKSKKKLGDTPPVKPLGTEPGELQEDVDRKPPTWSSNLIDVIERSRAATGAIPKVRSTKQLREDGKERYGDIDSEIEEDYNEMERALKDFQRGEIREQRRKREKRSKADDLDLSSSDDNEDENGKEKYDLENFLDLNETEYEQELQEDALLVKYFRDTINKRAVQKDKDSLKDNIRGTLPVESGIPLTTPKPSVSPKRLNIFPPIYASDEPLLRDTTKQTDTGSPKPTCSYSCSGRDADMDRIFQEASAIAKFIEDDLEPDYSGTEERYEEEEVYEPLPEPQAPPSEPTQRVSRGSPAAHKIFADVIPPLMEQIKPEDTTQQRRYSSETSDQDNGMSMAMPMPQVPAANQEFEYLDSLFERDKKTANTLKNVSNIISDTKQDQPASIMPSPRSPKICSDQQSPAQTRQEIKSPAITPSRPSSSTKITQSSTRITTSIPSDKYRDTSQSGFDRDGQPSPASSADDRIFDFAKGYVPPAYKSPPKYMSPTGVGSESPPSFMSPGKDKSPSIRTSRQPAPPPTTSPTGQRICPSARRKLNFTDVDTDTFLAQSEARQQAFLPQSPPVKPKMGFRGMDTDTFLADAMARQQDLPPLPPDYSPQQRMRTPSRQGAVTGWETPGRPSPTTSSFPQATSPSQMIGSEQAPFYESPKTPGTPPFVVPCSTAGNLFDTSMGDQYSSPPTTPPGMQQMPDRSKTFPCYRSPKTPVQMPPFDAPYSTADNLFDTSMGDQYSSPPPMSPGMQQMSDRVKSPPVYKSPKTPPFATADFASSNLADTSFGDLYYSPPVSPQISPGMQSPQTQRFQPCRAGRLNQQAPSPKIAGSPPPVDKFGLPLVAQSSPLSKFDYNQYYERYPDLQSPGRRQPSQPSSSRTPPAQVPSAKPRFGIYDMDTDTFLAEAMARQKDLPALPADYTPPSRRTPSAMWDSQEMPFPKTPPSYQMLDAIETPPFYDSPRTPRASPVPVSPDMSPGMRQMLDQLPQTSSFPCRAQKGTRPSMSGVQTPGRSGPSRRPAPSPLSTIAGSPPNADQSGRRYPGEVLPPSQSTRRPNPQSARSSQNETSYRPCPSSQNRRFSGQRRSK